MTSFTRKLHEIAPAAAKEIRRQNLHDYRYGKNVTLAQFDPAFHSLPESFGKRAVPQPCDRCGLIYGHRYPCGRD